MRSTFSNLRLGILALAFGCTSATIGCGGDDTAGTATAGAAGKGGSAGSAAGSGGKGGTPGFGGAAGSGGRATDGGSAGSAGGAAGSAGGAADAAPETGSSDAGPLTDASSDGGSGPDGGGDAADANCTGTLPPPLVFDGGPNPANVAQGGAVLMSTNCGAVSAAETPPHAFDGAINTKWLCFLQGMTVADLPAVSYRFAGGAAYAVNAYTVTSANDAPERDPKSWQLEGSNDEGATWTAVDVQTNQMFASRMQTNSFAFSNCVAYTRYRFVVTSILNTEAGTTNIFQVAEIQLFGPLGHGPIDRPNLTVGATVTTPSVCGGTNPAETVVSSADNDLASKWFCGGNTSPTVEIALTAAHAVNGYSVTAANDAPDRDPKSWMLQGTNDTLSGDASAGDGAADAAGAQDAAADAVTEAGAADGAEASAADAAEAGPPADTRNWVTVDTQTNQTFVNRYQTLTYSFVNTTAYLRYRLVVTSNNGSVDFQVAEIKLFGN